MNMCVIPVISVLLRHSQTLKYTSVSCGYVNRPYSYFTSHRNYAKKSNEKFKVNDQYKTKLILEMNFKTPEDALPFYNLPIFSLVRIYNTIKVDEKTGFCENRLYYLAKRIKYPASMLSEKVSNRIFIYTLSADWLKKSLDVLLEMGVPGNRIARDLWVLKYHHETISSRLKEVKSMGVDNLSPWMVRCSEEILKRTIKISQDAKNILGNNRSSTHAYLARRLNVSPEAVEQMCTKITALKTIRVTKVKGFLDFLIAEGFTVEEIASKPRIFNSSQKTIQERLKLLRDMGVKHVNLNILCRSVNDFNKYYETIKAAKVSKE